MSSWLQLLHLRLHRGPADFQVLRKLEKSHFAERRRSRRALSSRRHPPDLPDPEQLHRGPSRQRRKTLSHRLLAGGRRVEQ